MIILDYLTNNPGASLVLIVSLVIFLFRSVSFIILLTKVIQAALLKRKRAIAERSYNNGYDYAAGLILRKDTCPMEVQSRCFYGAHRLATEFDFGMEGAIDDLLKLKVITDKDLMS